jgi:choline dehydrogenase-like flavoprotein
VILTGGAIGSPTILMQSGIGPRSILQAAGVQVALDLPGVGQHLQDHIVCRFCFFFLEKALTPLILYQSVQLVYNTTADTATTLYPQLVNSVRVSVSFPEAD